MIIKDPTTSQTFRYTNLQNLTV